MSEPITAATGGTQQGPGTPRPGRTVEVIRHVAFEDLGVLEPLLAARGFEVHVVDAGVDQLDAEAFVGADLAIVLGGPISVYDDETYPVVAEEVDAVRRRLDAQAPTLGVCLGAQMMAAALGGSVSAGPVKEIGFAPLESIPATRGGLAELDGVPVLHWHGDTFTLPAGATLLASTAAYPNQAFSYGTSLALQFHLEADPARIEQWLIGHAHELSSAGIDPRVIREDARRFGPGLVAAGQRVLSDWIDRALAEPAR